MSELTFTPTFSVDPERLYSSWSSALGLQEWLAQIAQVDPRPDGPLYLWWEDGYYMSGHFTEVVPGERLCFTWQGRGEAVSQVEVQWEAQADGTRLRLSHKGLPDEGARQRMAARWQVGFEALEEAWGTGIDPRLARRPIFGLTLATPLTEESARQAGVPVREGLLVDGVIREMGPYQVGIRPGDVLTRLADMPLRDYPSLLQALRPYRAGDEVEVVYYRGADVYQAQVRLSARPMPEVPAALDELVATLRATYQQLDAERMELFEGATEEEAAMRPAAGSWSAREVLAHLIITERISQQRIGNLVGGSLPSEWDANLQSRLDALLMIYPTVVELVAEGRRSERETLALLAALPPSFLARRASYQQMGGMLLYGLPSHTRLHFEQIRQALASVREGV